MKLSLRSSLLLLVVSVLGAIALAQSEPLGDVARQQRAAKKTTSARVISNEDLPTSAVINVTGPDTQAAEDEDKEDKNKDKDKDKDKEKAASTGEGKQDQKPGEEAKDKDQKTAEATESAARKRVEDQKKEISTLERELHILQRESELDNPPAWMGRENPDWVAESKRRKSAEEIAAKKEAIEAAKQKLEEIQEEARKSGMPTSATE
ncbi:MAG: hypothetical protein ACE14M_02760 [Terriglobales bacterium]